ncbi:hypothetical protein KJ969_01480 [Patescibacteria group bacterium]|nr:hypothetical protein [Patescibacteria group bacterium]MBU1921783.1 hypothetical protein [Patescibacteria group bacterium]
MNYPKLILSAVIILVVGTAFSWLTCGWLFNWVYTIPPLIWHTPETMMSASSFALGILFGIVHALMFVLVYAVLYKGIPCLGAKKGLVYGFLMWLVGALAGMISMPVYMTIAWTVIIYWIAQALALNLINGAIVGAIYKPKTAAPVQPPQQN